MMKTLAGEEASRAEMSLPGCCCRSAASEVDRNARARLLPRARPFLTETPIDDDDDDDDDHYHHHAHREDMEGKRERYR